ncbi:unnamed protein product [Cuscuta epithymum]|uniref:CASP-like protein n=1 Tax=Cuscuta epithymum TaxID=186058 RepID=A0AAV0D906_9ASTE|nr:unnamed protein product [Cuscuta epithymum]
MENQIPKSNSSQNTLRMQSSHISISDTESQASQIDSFHSPLRYDSPLRSDEPFSDPDHTSLPVSSKAVSVIDKRPSPLYYPRKSSPSEHLSQPPTPALPPSIDRSSPKVYYSKSRAEPVDTKVGSVRGNNGQAEVGERRFRSAVTRAALGFRVCEAVFCLISFSVMAADKTQGWSGDSWDRYKEYRYCLAVNVIGFVYSGFQAFNVSYYLATKKHFISHHLRHHFDFAIDQVLAYLLMSASSSSATRVDDWVSNWGKDEFTEMAIASIAMSFLAFAAFALSSLLSGYNLCNRVA